MLKPLTSYDTQQFGNNKEEEEETTTVVNSEVFFKDDELFNQEVTVFDPLDHIKPPTTTTKTTPILNPRRHIVPLFNE
jgi:hypothetical protein